MCEAWEKDPSRFRLHPHHLIVGLNILALVLGEFPQAHVHRLDGVGGVDDLADLGGVVKERLQAPPVAPPRLTNR